MTLLEYVAERLMGPPTSRSGGRSTWLCPFHHDTRPSFCTLPPKAGCKDRYRCFGCGAWGDVFDLMKHFFDRENYGDRQARLHEWRQDYEREHPLSLSGGGVGRQLDPDALSAAFADLASVLSQPVPDWAKGELAYLRFLVHAGNVCVGNRISLDELSGEVAKYVLMAREFHDGVGQTADIPGRDWLREDDALAAEMTKRLRPVTPEQWAAFKAEKGPTNGKRD